MTPSRPGGAWAAATFLMLVGCGEMQPSVALPKADTAAEPAAPAGQDVGLGGPIDRSLSGLRAQDQRVANVAYRISTANVALCSDVGPQTGLVLQSALEYGPRLRPMARKTFHLDDRPAVEAVAAGSPAAAAGLRPDDILLAIGGEPLPAPVGPPADGPDTRPANYASIETTQARLAEALKAGSVVPLTLERGGAAVALSLSARPGCAYDAQVLPGTGLSASADGRHVFISTGMAEFARSDDMLALVLGHEFAHDVLHHRARLDQVGLARKTLGDLGSTPGSLHLAEREADYVGLYLAARAGYDISQAPEFWRRFPEVAGELSWSHPDADERATALAATRDEILAKLKAGQPLVPNAPAPR